MIIINLNLLICKGSLMGLNPFSSMINKIVHFTMEFRTLTRTLDKQEKRTK